MSLNTKITISLVCLSISTAITVGIISHIKYEKTIKNESYKGLELLVKSHGQELEKQINFIEKYSILLESVLKQSFNWKYTLSNIEIEKYKASIIPLLDTIAQKFRPLSYWIIFNPEYFNGGHTISFIDKNGDGTYTREEEYNVNDYDLNSREMKWWVDAIKKEETWTNPYFWSNWNTNLITYARSIDIDGKKIAVLGSDIDFDKFKSDIATRKIYNSGYFWIFDSNFNFIYHPNLTGNNLSNIEPQRLIFFKDTVTTKSVTGIVEYNYLDEEKIMAFYQLSNNWFLCSGTPKEEIFADLNQTKQINILIILTSLLVSVFISFIIGRSISNPVYQLVNTIRKGSSGDYTVRANIKSNDEFKELATYFNYFMVQLESTISRLKKNEMKLIFAKEKAEESDRLKSAFLANLSHEIRTPMNAIVGFTNLLTISELDEKTKNNYITNINKSTFDLLDIINNIIDFSILEANKVENEYSTFSLTKFLESVYTHFSSELINNGKENIDLKLVCDTKSGDELWIKGDKTKLHQVFTNVLNNSIKFTQKGYIKVGYKKDKYKIQFYVEDSGIGISEEDLKIIFDRFQKGKNTGNTSYRGTGLGLTICTKLIQLMHGEIWIKSIKNEGTTVYFSIPYLAVNQEEQ